MNWDSKYFEAVIYCLAIRIDSFCNLSLRLTSYLIIYKIMCVCKQPPSCHFKTLRSMWIEWALDINLCNINGHKKCKNVSNRKAYQTMKVFFYVECWNCEHLYIRKFYRIQQNIGCLNLIMIPEGKEFFSYWSVFYAN